MRKIFSGLLAACLAFAGAESQGAIVLTGTSFTEDFNTLPTATVAGVFSATVGTQAPAASFDGTKIGGTGTAATGLTADTGSIASGGIYSYGAAADADRALGMVASGTNIMAIGVQITNNTGADLTSLTVSFTQENWRSSTSVTNVMPAEFSTTATASTYLNDLTPGVFSAVSSLDLTGPAFVASNGALNGNDPANQLAKTFTFSTLLTSGSSLFIRWRDTNDLGNDAGLAIDNFSVSTVAVPEPSSMALLVCCGAAGVIYRRRRSSSKF